MTRILVLDSDCRSALALTRSVGRLNPNIEIINADCTGRPLSAASRFSRQSDRYVSPASSLSEFHESLQQMIIRKRPDFVVPMTDLTLAALLPYSSRFPETTIVGPQSAAYFRLSDKWSLINLAISNDVPVPESGVVKTEDEADSSWRCWPEPTVLKPARSVVEFGDKIVETSVSLFETAREAYEQLMSSSWFPAVPCVVQRWIPGSGGGVFAHYGPSGPVAWFAHKRIREKPPSGGVSVYSRSVLPDPILVRHSSKILDSVKWSGPAMVEFRIDPNGNAFLMEVNGRLWGSVQLAIDCGVDFPAMLLGDAMGMAQEPILDFDTNRGLRWYLGDLDHYLIRMKSEKGVRSLMEVLKLAISSMNFFQPGTRLEVLRPSDPRPFFREARAWIKNLLHRGR